MATTLDNALLRRLGSWRDPAAKAIQIGRFLGYAWQRFSDDRCLRQAAGLGYVSLLAVVPLLAIALGVLSAFPAFEEVRRELQALVFENFLPETGDVVTDQLTFFLENASKATGPGVIAFLVTAVLLLNNITDAFNVIWRVSEPRPILIRLLVYWMLLTLGPLLIATSMTLSGQAFAMLQVSGIETYTGPLARWSRLVSIGFATLLFAIIYLLVPNRTIRLGHALLGGLVAALLAELLKYGFGLYLGSFHTYQAIYGALSAVPVILVWMYLYWTVVLFGAEIAAALPEWQAGVARGHHVATPGEWLILALTLLARLRAASRRGGALRERALVRDLLATPAEIDEVLLKLRKAEIVERAFGGKWLLARDLSTLSLGALAGHLGVDLECGEGWPDAAVRAVREVSLAAKPQLERSLEEVLGEETNGD